jgi:hypothetical protein
MARIYARAKFSVTGVTPLCDNELSVILRNLAASRAGLASGLPSPQHRPAVATPSGVLPLRSAGAGAAFAPAHPRAPPLG